MGNSIENKDWFRSNQSLSRFMEKAKTTTKCKEFYKKSMKDLLETNNVQLYSETENEEKSSIVQSSETCGNISVQTTRFIISTFSQI